MSRPVRPAEDFVYLSTLLDSLSLQSEPVIERLISPNEQPPPELALIGALYIVVGNRMVDYARQHSVQPTDGAADEDGGS